MKIKSVSSLSCLVKDIDKTVGFYESLGFDFKRREKERATGYVNWFSIDFLLDSGASAAGSGNLKVYLSVDDVDATHQELVGSGQKAKTEPTNTPNGNREFEMLDPDGYALVFFKKR